MADQDEYFYLQPGFDAGSLTVARLRSILVAHDIRYPSSAKKPELVDLFEENVLPQAKKLLRERDRVRRTSRGITDVPSSQEGTIDETESDDRERMPPPKTPRSRKSRTQLSEAEVEQTPKTTRRSKTPSSRRSTRAPRVSDAETTETEQERIPQSTRRTRKSTPAADATIETPAVRLRDAVDKRKSLEAEESPFTQDNPFQQNSSPASDTKRAPSSSRTRKSIGTSSTRKSTSRRTRSPVQVKRESIEFPVSHLSTGADGVETTEEFTQDARAELGEEMAHDQRLVKARSKDVKRHRKQPKSTAAKAAPWTVLITVLSTIGAWYRKEKIAVGYCGVGQPQWSLAEVDSVPYWVHEAFSPECEPCPQHALCHPNMEVECEHDFVLTQHPLSLNGVVPLPPTCEPDSEKEKRVKVVADKAVEALRNQRASYECGYDVSSQISETSEAAVMATPSKLEITEEDLKDTIAKQRRKGMSESEFEDLWNSALGDIESRDEIEIVRDKSGRTCFISNSFANLPFTCAIRRSLIRTLVAHTIPIILMISTIASSFYGYARLQAYNTAKQQTPSLVTMTLDRLATQAALHDAKQIDEPFISVGQLRDDVLRNVFKKAERERAWERVRKIVEANSNVRAATREGGKTGEWSRVWEWIGPTNFVPGLEGRRSGGLIGSSPATGNGTPGSNDGSGAVTMIESRRWDEGRPIY